jgi:hypothetical protein
LPHSAHANGMNEWNAIATKLQIQASNKLKYNIQTHKLNKDMQTRI